MITVRSSPRPGSGVSTTAALVALAARHDPPTHLVDLCGEQRSLLGLVTRPGATVEVAERLTIRDLTAHDIASITCAPNTATIEIDPHIARATDVRLLSTQPLATVLTALAGLTDPPDVS